MSGAVKNTAAVRNDDTSSASAQNQHWRWWDEADLAVRAQKITAVAGELYKQLEPVRRQMLQCARLYGNAPIVGLGPRAYSRATGAYASRWARICINVAKAVADTYVSLITKDRPKVTVLTSGATHDVQQKAKNIEKFCDGVFYENDLHELDNQLVLDTAEFPLSVEHWYADTWSDPKNPRIVCERRLPWELLVDEASCQYGQLPQEIYLTKSADRWALVDEYRKRGATEIAKALETAACGQFDAEQSGGYEGAKLTDIVTVVETYRRPLVKGAKGLHCIVVGNVMLNPKDQDWSRLEFPVELNWRIRPSSGIFGSSLVDELAGIQRELNVLMAKIARSHHLCAVPHLLVHKGSEVNTNGLDNQVASLIGYTGEKPVPLVYQAITNDVYQHAWNLRDAAFAIIGVNAMNANGQLPPGVKSGRAMRTLADVTTQRFQPCYRQFQGLYLRRCRQVIALAREIAAKHGGFKTRAPTKGMVEDVVWLANALPDESFLLKLYPTNALADDPAERIEQVQEIQGLPPEMKRLLDFPDLEAAANYEQANYDLTMRIADEIITKGKYHAPIPEMNLNPEDEDGSIKWMGRVSLRARIDQVPEERLRMLRDWITQATTMWTDAHPPPPPAPALPAGPMQPINGAPPGAQQAPPMQAAA